MKRRALIVEDEILVALDIENALRELGIEVVGIAADSQSALSMAADVDFALVDINLRDGQTGPMIGRTLARDYGVSVIFVTANPSLLGDGVEGTMGVLTKPFSDQGISATVSYITMRDAARDVSPPPGLHLFN
ncbi:response regulator [Sphingobium boeckii]|uniref:DNA-binding response OmpR family regulator n=1 Tax=Sphingobium boeckii TaxID=1082345 RepID=A0A7W9AGC9_9SPHN|nr:response regulator [Sphingobium boeckii]MBB5685208.1 DNA-binding response OmpR family regulator [Sphingobium boeckii]